jgi:hypothetical protein
MCVSSFFMPNTVVTLPGVTRIVYSSISLETLPPFTES